MWECQTFQRESIFKEWKNTTSYKQTKETAPSPRPEVEKNLLGEQKELSSNLQKMKTHEKNMGTYILSTCKTTKKGKIL